MDDDDGDDGCALSGTNVGAVTVTVRGIPRSHKRRRLKVCFRLKPEIMSVESVDRNSE